MRDHEFSRFPGSEPIARPARRLAAHSSIGVTEMIDHKTRDRALFQIMINEGWSREEVNELIATKDHVELDRLYNRLSADTERRARDVPISTDKGVISIHEMRLRA